MGRGALSFSMNASHSPSGTIPYAHMTLMRGPQVKGSEASIYVSVMNREVALATKPEVHFL